MEDGDEDNNSAEGAINYKFEIERTDSLEFTRNSDENDELTMVSGGKSRRSTLNKRKMLDRGQEHV